MNQTSDLDRLLDDWLTDGPNRAPDQPITAASQFARAHPRRPDPLRIFRSDPMADRRRAPFGLQPGLIFALLALVVAIVAAGVIGSRLEKPVLVPPPTTATPSAPPTSSPDSSVLPILRGFFLTDLATTAGAPAMVDVVDRSHLIADIASGSAIEGGTVDRITVTNDAADRLRVTWPGSPCDTVHRLTLDETATHLVLERPICRGDAMPRDLAVLLTFSRAIDASSVAASIVEGKGAGGLYDGVGRELPNWTVDGPDTAGNAFHASIFDRSTRLTAAESTSQGGGGATLPTDKGRIDQVAPDTIKLTWARSACDADEQLTIDANPRVLTLVGTGCSAGPATRAYDREVTLTFSSPVSAAGMRLDVEVAR
jgi:hypothetical protein